MQADSTFSGPDGTFIKLTGNVLRAGNPLFERTWTITADGSLQATSFRDGASSTEWVSRGTAVASPGDDLRLELRAVDPETMQAGSLVCDLAVHAGQAAPVYRLQVFPAVRGVRISRHAAGATASQQSDSSSSHPGGAPTGVEAATPQGNRGAPAAQTPDAFACSPQHLRLVQVSLQDQTDEHNELVFERDWLLHTAERTLELTGCLFCLEEVLTGAGLVFVKEAPLPHARPAGLAGPDLVVQAASRTVALTGEEYPCAVLAYSGGRAGRIAVLHAYQRAIRPYVAGRDGLLLSNTWGDRNRDARIAAGFLQQEIAAGARLGVDVIQIDDGWQTGATSNSARAAAAGGVWEGYYAKQADFWSINAERFPDGLEPLVAAARKHGMRFGLWFSPDSSNDFANWQRDVQTILGLHRDLGIDYVKVDGVHLRSPIGARNLQAFFRTLLAESQGRIVFDLDVTAQIRPGYMGLIETGPLFVENRYTDWHRYWPHYTLRNLWKLSHYIDPVRLRMEWLNNQRNAEKYAGDPLAPATYRPDYLFATVMFASPLGWFEISSLPEAYFTEAAPLIAVWKAHRERIQRGTILPIGDPPDGVCWTGFISHDAEGLYVLAFRELNASAEWTIVVPSLCRVQAERIGERLGGDGEATLLPGGRIRVHVPDARRFLFARVPYEPV